MSSPYSTFGVKAVSIRIKEFRLDNDLKIQRMATKAGVDPKHLKRIEDGISDCSFIVLCRLMKSTKKDITDFFDDRFEYIYSNLIEEGDGNAYQE